VTNRLYDWNPAKAAINRQNHGIPFSAVEGFDWETALVTEDHRHDYGEDRFVALGKIGGRVHVLVFTPRGGKVWVISLRKANEREVRHYEQG
jgi:uncharacterized protein